MVGSVLSGVKISSAISATRSTNGTFFTVPAESFAIFQIRFTGTSGDSGNVLVDGKTIADFSVHLDNAVIPKYTSSGASATNAASSGSMVGPFFAGPGQAVTLSQSGSPGVDITGVIFVNTP